MIPRPTFLRWHRQTETRAAAYDAEHGAGAWERAQKALRTGPTMIASHLSLEDWCARAGLGRL